MVYLSADFGFPKPDEVPLNQIISINNLIIIGPNYPYRCFIRNGRAK